MESNEIKSALKLTSGCILGVSFFTKLNSLENFVSLISPASINENVFKSLKIYPNPTSKKTITVSFDNDLKQVEVYSVMGKMITNIVSVYDTKNKINLSNLPSGIFYLKITTEGAAITKKIIVN